MPVIKTGPRVVVSVTATGGGDWQVVSTPTGFQGITSALFSDNDYIHGFCRFENGVDWEEYDTDSDDPATLLRIANVSGTVTITRPAAPYASSNGGARVAVVTGTHTLAISLGSGTMRRILREVNGTWKNFTSGDATPTVADHRLFKTAGTTTLTAFDNMEAGKLFIVQRGASDITIADGAGISLPNNQNLTLTTHVPGAIFVEDAGVAILIGTVGPMDFDQVPNIFAATTLTIASGAITPTQASHLVDTEAAAASDDLTTITGTNFKAGDLLVLAAANGARDVVVKATGGNILLPNDADITLNDTERTLVLRYDGTNWNHVAGAATGGFNAAPATTLTIASGVITPTLATHLVDTESAAASDDLVTITGTNFVGGSLLAISAANASRDVVVKATGGNILLPGDSDITLDDTEKTLILRYDGANWNYVAGQSGSGDVIAVADKTALAALTLSASANLETVVVNDPDYGGTFARVTSDISALVTADQAAALYVPFSGANGSTGGFVRRFYGPIEASWYGASPAASAATNATALGRWLTAIAGTEGRIRGGTFTTSAVFQPKDGSTIYAGGAFMWHRSGYLYSKSTPTVIKGDGAILTGANSTVGLFSKTACGVSGSDFNEPDTDDYRDVRVIGGLHFDAAGASYAATYYRARDCQFGTISHSGATRAGFMMAGCFGNVEEWHFGAFFNLGHGFVIGEDDGSTAYGTEEKCYNLHLDVVSVGNGAANAYVKFDPTNDLVGSGGIFAGGRGSKITLSSEGNVGRAYIVRPSGGSGAAEIIAKYIEGNGDGPAYLDYDTLAWGMVTRCGFFHPGNGVTSVTYLLADGATSVFTLLGATGLTAAQIEVYIAGVRKTPTTDYTVANSGGDLSVTIVAGAPAANAVIHIKAYNGANKPQDITLVGAVAGVATTDAGPDKSSEWIRFEDLCGRPTNNAKFFIAIKSNTYRYRVTNCSESMTFTHRPPTPSGAYASGFLSWNGTSISHRADAQAVGGLAVSHFATGAIRLTFPPKLVQYGSGGTIVQNYQLHISAGYGSTKKFDCQVGSATVNLVEIRCFDETTAAPHALADPDVTTTIKYTLTRIDD